MLGPHIFDRLTSEAERDFHCNKPHFCVNNNCGRDLTPQPGRLVVQREVLGVEEYKGLRGAVDVRGLIDIDGISVTSKPEA